MFLCGIWSETHHILQDRETRDYQILHPILFRKMRPGESLTVINQLKSLGSIRVLGMVFNGIFIH